MDNILQLKPHLRDRFILGKLFHKFLILKLFEDTLSRPHAMNLLYYASKRSRSYLTEYFNFYRKLPEHSGPSLILDSNLGPA